VIEAVEGPIHLNRCLVHPGACPRDSFCTAHPVWRRIQEILTRELDSVTLASLAAGRSCAGVGNGSGSPARPSEASVG
jgi:DNA-binding IscR family transcriptional regulator